jgi:D-alanyl-D-alanine-carboxypeptidase/D-alanyl-D-alanine-endopeptidase
MTRRTGLRESTQIAKTRGIAPGRARRPRHGALAALGAIIVAAGMLSVAPAASAATADDSTGTIVMTPELSDRIQKNIEDFQAKYNIPGMSVAVVTPSADGPDPVITQFAVGTPTLGSSTAVDASTQFEIASTTKAFTADLLAYLVAEGTVSLDDPVQKYAPAGITVPVWTDPDTGATTQITLRDLATHQAGLPDSPENYGEACDNIPNCTNPLPYYTPKMQWHALANHDLLWQPGTKWLYSNFGFGLLGVILAGVVESTPDTEPPAYEPAIKNAFLDDLKMSATTLGTGPDIATPYTNDNTRTDYLDDTNSGAGEGGLVSNAHDMAIWVAAHLGYVSADAPLGVRAMSGTLAPVSTITTECWSPTDCSAVSGFSMGLAWQLNSGPQAIDGVDWAIKNGGSGGFSSDTTLAPSKGIGVTTMWNQERPDDNDLEPGIDLLTLILNDHPAPSHDTAAGDHGGDHHDEPTLANTGYNPFALLISGLTVATLTIAAGLLLAGRSRTTRTRSRARSAERPGKA